MYESAGVAQEEGTHQYWPNGRDGTPHCPATYTELELWTAKFVRWKGLDGCPAGELAWFSVCRRERGSVRVSWGVTSAEYGGGTFLLAAGERDEAGHWEVQAAVLATDTLPGCYEVGVPDVGGLYRLSFRDATGSRRIVLAEDFDAVPPEQSPSADEVGTMRKITGTTVRLAWWLLFVPGTFCPSAGGQGNPPNEYHRQGVILTLTRADMPFASDNYEELPGEGTLVYSLGGILGGEKTFWLLREDLWEYDLQGNLVETIPFPEPNKMGRTTSYLASAKGIYLLQDHGWNWPSNVTSCKRLSYQFYSLADRKWFGPIPVPDVVDFEHEGCQVMLTARRGEVFVADTHKGLGVAISAGGQHCDPVTHNGAGDPAPYTLGAQRAANGRGLALVSKGAGRGAKFFEFVVLDANGTAIGRLLEETPSVEDWQRNREETPEPRWAILGDATVLQLEVSVRGEPDDAIRVIRWAPL